MLSKGQPFEAELETRFGIPKFVNVFDLVEFSVAVPEGKKSVKIDTINLGQLGIAGGGNGGEKWVINDMELGANIAGEYVSDATDGARMAGRDA